MRADELPPHPVAPPCTKRGRGAGRGHSFAVGAARSARCDEHMDMRPSPVWDVYMGLSSGVLGSATGQRCVRSARGGAR